MEARIVHSSSLELAGVTVVCTPVYSLFGCSDVVQCESKRS